MENKIIALIIILVICGLAIIALGSVAIMSSNSNNNDPQVNNINYGLLVKQQQADNSNGGVNQVVQDHPNCPVGAVDCFQYPEIPQVKLAPCLPARPVCPLCKNELDQTHGVGHLDIPIQENINC